MTTRFRPVNPRAVRRAPIIASVPEFANRTLQYWDKVFDAFDYSMSIGVERAEFVPRCVMVILTA